MIQYGNGGCKCAISACPNYSNQRNARSFFRFPRDPELCEKWIIATGRTHLLEVAKRHGYKRINSYRLCADHFAPSCFRNPKLLSQGLKRGTLPTLLVDPCFLQQQQQQNLTSIDRPTTGSDIQQEIPSPERQLENSKPEIQLDNLNAEKQCQELSLSPRDPLELSEKTWHQELPVIMEFFPDARFPDCSREELEFQIMLLSQNLEDAEDKMSKYRMKIKILQEENATLKARISKVVSSDIKTS